MSKINKIQSEICNFSQKNAETAQWNTSRKHWKDSGCAPKILEASSHIIISGKMGRKSGAKDNHHPIPKKYHSLIDKVIEFNKKQRQ